jgi:putative ABC transport system permease protein
MAMTLLIAGGLLMHSFVRLMTRDSGYDPHNLLTFQVRLPASQASAAELKEFAAQLAGRLRRLPGINAIGYSSSLPLEMRASGVVLKVDPSEVIPQLKGPGPATAYNPRLLVAGGDYFKALGNRIVYGRALNEQDGSGQPQALVINETLSRARFGNVNPVGRRVYIDNSPWEIVGVSRDIRETGPDQEPSHQIFIDFRQWKSDMAAPSYFMIRTVGSPLSVLPAVNTAVRQLNANGALENVASMEQLVVSSLSRQRVSAVLIGVFAVLALVIAAIGIYGAMAYTVTQSTREIGIRMALGAQRYEMLRLVLRQGLTLVGIGIAIGLAGAFGLTRYLSSMLFGLTALNAPTYAAAVAFFVFVALAAAYLPAHRATRIDPLVAIRHE